MKFLKKSEADNHPITSSFCVNKTGDLKREWPIVFCEIWRFGSSQVNSMCFMSRLSNKMLWVLHRAVLRRKPYL